jgi:antitoxin HicB
MRYRVKLTPAENGDFISELPDFPIVFSTGKDEEEALAMVYDAFLAVCSSSIQDKEPIPIPKKRPKAGEKFIDVPALVVAKIAIHNAMHEQGVSQVGLAARLGIDPKSVRRLLNLGHTSHWPHLEAALSELGYRVDAEVRRVA